MAGARAYGRAAQSALSPAQASLILHERLCQEVVAAKAAYEAKRLDTMCRHTQKCMTVLLALSSDLAQKPKAKSSNVLNGLYLHLFERLLKILRHDDVVAEFDDVISLMHNFNRTLSLTARAAA